MDDFDEAKIEFKDLATDVYKDLITRGKDQLVLNNIINYFGLDPLVGDFEISKIVTEKKNLVDALKKTLDGTVRRGEYEAYVEDLSEEFGVSRERVRQIETAALKKMRGLLQAA